MKTISLLVSAACVGFMLVACGTQAKSPINGEFRSDRLSPEFRAFVEDAAAMSASAMRKNRIPGLSVAIVDEQGPLWEAGFGFADRARKVPVTPNTRFSIQSMSKTFTSVAVLSAVQDGLLDLDEPISSYLPDFAVNSIFEKQPVHRITLRHLLTHTAGFTHEAPLGNNYTPGTPSFDDHVASIQKTWLKFSVGQRQSYSNLGIDLAGYIVENVRGRPFVQVMQDTVLAPLGLDRTTNSDALILSDSQRAVGHRLGLDRVPVITPMLAAGGIWSTAHDLGRFVVFMLDEGRRGGPLQPSTFEELRTTANGGDFGLGIAYGRMDNGDLFLNHGGGGFGFLTRMEWYPTLGVGVVILTNSSNHHDAHVALAHRLIAAMETRGLARRRFALQSEPVSRIDIRGAKGNDAYFRAHPEKAEWRQGWERYLGRYSLSIDTEPLWWARLALRLGLSRDSYVKVTHTHTGIALDGSPMTEAEPGLFFTFDGEALDFRGSFPTWRNIPLTRL